MIYYDNGESNTINYIQIPAIMAFIGSYLITTLFFTIYKTAVDTLFLCFLEDCECNDGTQQKPYYMSMRLKKLLQK
jgi:choline transporter-like protein 2/4/5